MRRLVGWARRVGGNAACGPVAVLSGRTEELVVGAGSLVVKQHPQPVPRATLLLADRRRDIFVPPLAASEVGGWPVTLWPRGVPVREADLHGPGPWAAAGGLLATLHRTPAPPGTPPCGAPARVERALDRLAAGPPGFRSKIICDALGTVRVPHARPTTLVHGDFHLGQVVSLGGARRLIDLDTVGLGDPAWDLARMAAWYLAGVVPAEAWTVFLTAYGAAGGPAVVPGADPWPVLDQYARTLAAQTAALAVVNQDLDTAETFVAACRRMLTMAGDR
ncbi:phosphotransferase family protein [Virgisporangium ochraceum]|uniref:Aminoglycoside phosphotransferase n=1 Tax=Virgisporangium ochraceum TaxID=65505 RepID=A0A8J3ZQX7_9ACTN|nr:aminoglycoside phosphotransferase family protein [Virgisporangium ochraceum]GIJ68279.1 aminoglycoside phosphotransferase [Virgisporangium ochraceum]